MNKKWLSIALAIAICVSLILAACGGSTPPAGQAQPTAASVGAGGSTTSAPSEATTPTVSTGRSLTIVSAQGKVDAKTAGQTDFSAASAKQTLGVGDEVRTGPNGRAVLQLDDGTQMVLGSNSSFQVEALDGTTADPISKFLLNIGQLFAVH